MDILVLRIFARMSLPLRITFEDNDYTYIVLDKLIDRNTKEIRSLLEERELTLFKNERNEWDARERTIEDKSGLIKAIARNVALRYRL